MRLLLTPILYLGLICPASVFATPIRTTPDPTEGHSTGSIDTRAPSGVHGEGPVTEYSVEVKLWHIRPKDGKYQPFISEEVAGWLGEGVRYELPWILPVFDARQKHRPLDPKTVPDKRSSFRVTKLTYMGSSTHISETIGQAEHFRESMPPEGVFWLDITVLNPNGSLRARLYMTWVHPEIFERQLLYFFEYFSHHALVGQVGYGEGDVKVLLASVDNMLELRLPDATTFTFTGALEWVPSTSEPQESGFNGNGPRVVKGSGDREGPTKMMEEGGGGRGSEVVKRLPILVGQHSRDCGYELASCEMEGNSFWVQPFTHSTENYLLSMLPMPYAVNYLCKSFALATSMFTVKLLSGSGIVLMLPHCAPPIVCQTNTQE
ncbi:hypothetical protein EV360DRAFT_72207 [Lentinula raphanica]|nr:hypothetical protein EV360DRAFT_72207 [Lentinula raphanica]